MKQTTTTDTIKEFNKRFCNVYSGDSGMGGNDPQESVDEWATDNPQDVRDFLLSAISKTREETIEECKKALYKKYIEQVPKFESITPVEIDMVLASLKEKQTKI